MVTFPDQQFVFSWRYLDSLDSVRFSERSLSLRGATRNSRLKQAEIEVCAATLMGNGIIVPNNQLIDSIGFLRIASDIIRVANDYESKGKHVFIPLKYANFYYPNEVQLGGGPHLKDPFLLAAYLFNKDGTDAKPSFELSAWPTIQPYRAKWAKELSNYCLVIKDDLLRGVDDFEKNLANDLLRVLHFFNNNRLLIIDAAPTSNIREKLVRSISKIDEGQIETDQFLQNLISPDNKNMEKIISISTTFKKLENTIINGKPIISNRTSLYSELFNNSEQLLEEGSYSKELLRMGVMETIDSIYNFSGFISTTANQDVLSEPMDQDTSWGYDEAAFALGQWAREQFMAVDNIVQEDISSSQDAYINPFTLPDINLPIISDSFWDKFFEFQQNEKWVTSITNYSAKLRLFEKYVNTFLQQSKNQGTPSTPSPYLLDLEKCYKDARAQHIYITNEFFKDRNFEIIIDGDSAFLEKFDDKRNILSKIQIEDFSKTSLKSKLERGAIHAREVAKDITVKENIAEYNG